MPGFRVTRLRAAVLALLLVMPARAASAQTVLNPTTAEFNPSSDHDATFADGTPIVDRYTLAVYTAGAVHPIETINLGKPLPATDGKIRVRFVDLLTTPLVPGVLYEARVSAAGPGGLTPSAVSNTFALQAVCSPAIAPLSQSVGFAGGTGTVAVTVAAGCTWSAVSNVTWITLTNGVTGTGNGAVAFTVAANAAQTARTGAVTIAGQSFTVTQAANSCTFSVAPTMVSAPSTGSTGSVAVTTGSSCAWTATSGVNWITITSAASMTGLGSVNYTVAANTTNGTRTGTMTVAGQTVTVTQAANSCAFSVAPTTVSAPSTGGTGSVAVTTGSSCAWTAASGGNWITITSGASMTGLGSVNYAIEANTKRTSRTATMTIAGQTVTVTQAANSCTYSVSPMTVSAPSTGSNGSVAVTTGSSCAWTAASGVSWITITSGASMTGLGSANYTVAANAGASTRTGTMTIAGQAVTVTQPGVSCTSTLSPTSASLTATAGSTSVTVTSTAGCAWAAASNAAWITVTSGASGTGTGTVTLSVAANTTTSSRTGTATIAGQTFTVTQPAQICTYAISPSSQSVTASGGVGSTAVSAIAGCAWTAASAVSWITVTSGQTGMGNGTTTFSIAANTGAAPRAGTLTIAGRTFQVTQSGTACSYSIAPTTHSVAAAGETGTVNVTTTSGCPWSSISTVSWITVSGSGTGSGSASYTVAVNNGMVPRTGTILIGGGMLTVTQAAKAPPRAPTNLRVFR